MPDGSVRGANYVIDDSALVCKLRQFGYEVTEHPNNWYLVYPEFGKGITLLDGVPIAKHGINLVSLLGFASVAFRIAFFKQSMMRPEKKLQYLEELRTLIHNAIPLTTPDSHVRRGVETNLEYVTGEVLALGYTPANLVNPRQPVEYTRIDSAHDIWNNKIVKHKVEDIPFKVTINDECLEKMNALAAPTHSRIRHLRKALAKPLYEVEDFLSEEEKPEPVTPGRAYIDKATQFKNTLSPDEAASSMLTCYNNAAYEDHRSAADRIEAMINELGYTVVRGFDDTDPAQIVKTL